LKQRHSSHKKQHQDTDTMVCQENSPVYLCKVIQINAPVEHLVESQVKGCKKQVNTPCDVKQYSLCFHIFVFTTQRYFSQKEHANIVYKVADWGDEQG